MADIYIRTDSKTGVVTFVHRRPFDPVHGLGETRDNLLKTGFFVDEFPEPNASLGKKATAYYDHERKKIYYEYEIVPFSEKQQLSMIQDMINDTLVANGQPTIATMSLRSAGRESEIVKNGLAKYLAYQIYQGKLDKEIVMNSYPVEASAIEAYLDEWNVIPTVEEPGDIEE